MSLTIVSASRWLLINVISAAVCLSVSSASGQGLGADSIRRAKERLAEARKADEAPQEEQDIETEPGKDVGVEQASSLDIRLISGGLETTIERNPWQTALLYARDPDRYRSQFCGGVIVHPHWVLTSAHCLDRETRIEDVLVLSGTANLVGEGGMISSVTQIVIHPSWNRDTHDSDIALLRVEETLGIPIALTSSGPTKGGKVWVSGWGIAAAEGSPRRTTLQGILLNLIPITKCNGPRSYGGRVTDNMFCAGYARPDGGGGRPEPCLGDGGAPVTIGSGDSARLIGLGSWGAGCAQPYKYGVYTNVSKFLRWITESTNGEVRL